MAHPLWVPDGRYGDRPHPLLPLVLNRVGSRNPNTVIAQLAELTRRHRQGEAHDAFHMYDGKLPIVGGHRQPARQHTERDWWMPSHTAIHRI
ncbi:hypothetical protein [Streptomyces sp. NRRL B-3648]|uniref:hypothetical protein n=1 Tax=Streptomyces sp. NRRL B-3648 TaxID=1519493 RepID=UPI0006B0362B|nr:hypothetical protein [Streptomyces sp. NRRL B-3648]